MTNRGVIRLGTMPSAGWKLFVCLLLALPVSAASADWMRFRGPNGSGVAEESAKTPTAWSAKANLRWKTEMPGAGVSSPIIVGDRLYVTAYSGYGLSRENPGEQSDLRRHLVSVDRKTGKIIWDKVIEPVLPEDPYTGIGVPGHGYASNSPVSDGENIFVFFGKTGVLAFDKQGKQLWQTNVGKESDPRKWGSANSIILYEDLVIVPAAAESEALIALDKRTGKEVWRQEAAGLTNSWSTPLLVEANGRTDLVMTVVKEIWGMNPRTGELRWFCKGPEARSFSSSPIAVGDTVYTIEGQIGVSMAVRAGGTGDVTESHLVWKGKDKARFCSPIAYKDRLYSFANGVVSVIDIKTGERVNRVRLKGGSGRAAGDDYASPIVADGKFYLIKRNGEAFVLTADEKLETLAVNVLTDEAEDFSATPAVAGGDMYIRSSKHLYCVAELGDNVEPVVFAQREESDEEEEGRGGRRGRRNRRDPAQMFASRDANGDGKLSGDEIDGRLKDAMEQLDKNKDKEITLEEFREGLRNMRRNRGGGQGGDSGKPKRPERPTMES